MKTYHKMLILSGYKKNEDGSFQRHVESVAIEDMKKGGFKFDKKESALGDHFLFVLSTKNSFGDMRTVRIYITESDYHEFQNFLNK